MEKIVRRWNFSVAYLSVLLFVSGCEKQYSNETGFLEGKISIGPICPVERVPPDPAWSADCRNI